MPVLLRASRQLPDAGQFDHWLAVTGSVAALDKKRILPDLAKRLEAAFDKISKPWWRIAREAGKTPSSKYSFAMVCSPIASDFGLMLAWAQLAADHRES